ncbi:Magnesium transporter NIPA2 [Lamellibrachia satsuma]|nr:Magnesium transporter NIPA2 [Lamellibrachia satsuma]
MTHSEIVAAPGAQLHDEHLYWTQQSQQIHFGDRSRKHKTVTMTETQNFYIGLFLATFSSILIGSSFIVKKKALLNLSVRAGQGGYGYLRDPLWWLGMTMMASGECFNFAAYAFAPATMVTPLGALSVLVSAILASRMLGEKLNILGKVGCLISILGSTIVVLHAPKEQNLKTMAELGEKLHDPGFVIYAFVVIVMVVVLIFYCEPHYGQKNPLIYVTVTGAIGSLTVMACKGLGVVLKQTFQGDSQLTNWLSWLLALTVIICISVQMIYLNKALDVFNTSVVTPILYVVFTSCVILASAILFKEWGGLPAEDIAGVLCGFFTVVSGIFLLQAFKDMNISMSSLPRVKKEPASAPLCNGNYTGIPSTAYEEGADLIDVKLHKSTSDSGIYKNGHSS